MTNFWKKVKEYFFVTVAGVLNAVTLYSFVNPSNLVAGGFSGLSSVVAHVICAIDGAASFDVLQSIVYFLINLPLLICSLIFLRGDFTFKTIWATIACSFALWLFPIVAPNMKFSDSPLLAVVFGGILIGLSMYMASVYNGSNGGTEVIAKLVAKYHPEVNLHTVILISNFAITTIGSIVVMIIKNTQITVILYSLSYVILGAKSMGVFARGFDHPQKVCIVTAKHEEISKKILDKFGRGITLFDIVGTYGETNKKMIMVVVQYRQLAHLKALVKKNDPEAFTIIKDVYDVFSRPSFNRSYKNK